MAVHSQCARTVLVVRDESLVHIRRQPNVVPRAILFTGEHVDESLPRGHAPPSAIAGPRWDTGISQESRTGARTLFHLCHVRARGVRQNVIGGPPSLLRSYGGHPSRVVTCTRVRRPPYRVACHPKLAHGCGRAKGGGPDRDRTGDLLNAIQARSQLRYRPVVVRTNPHCTQRIGHSATSR